MNCPTCDEFTAQLWQDAKFIKMVRKFQDEDKKSKAGTNKWYELSNRLIRHLEGHYKVTSSKAINLINDPRWSDSPGMTAAPAISRKRHTTLSVVGWIQSLKHQLSDQLNQTSRECLRADVAEGALSDVLNMIGPREPRYHKCKCSYCKGMQEEIRGAISCMKRVRNMGYMSSILRKYASIDR